MQLDALGAAASRSPMTAEALEAWWPEASERLVRRLAAQGVDPATAEDAVAEAATRALSRALPVADVDDFCRWAYIVARNLASDSGRRRRRLVPLESLVEQPDRYDLARDVEIRQRWRETARAMAELSAAERTTLLATLDIERPTSRREAVRDAVRRHRARARLREALGYAGGFAAWVRRPAEWVKRISSVPWSVREDLGTLVLVALLAAPGASSAARTSPSSDVLIDGTGVAAPTPLETGPTTGGPTPAALTGGPLRLGPMEAPAVKAPDVAATGAGFQFTPSPSYDEDRTVYAAGATAGPCEDVVPRCPLLLKSSDGGESWHALPARDRDYGTVLLPPSYPRDPRIFSAGVTLSVSTDGGETFRVIGPAPGPAAMSPLFSSSDPRIVFGSDRSLRSPALTEYRDDVGAVVPLAPPLPPGVLPTDSWFGSYYAHDGRLFVAVSEPPGVATNGAVDARLNTSALYTCTATSCARAADLGVSVLPPTLAWSTRDPRTLFVANYSSLLRSVDGGETFTTVPLPGNGGQDRWIQRLTAGPNGRWYVSVSGELMQNHLFVSDDDGETWQLQHEAEAAFISLTALPDGVLLDVIQRDGGGIACSVDGGVTWSNRCRR